ncbi:RRXRR domain-containing protein [Nostoc sp. LEGE 06077]|uniref:RRXRR domain-containing protein n=1 Tax=Nostoc sp. LEGE 06077 TaxID=915325 RepID=UPI00187E545F|nr:RRXRR domain-containing protein [Nostoc sp. LEGE 06077]MBE9210895.1 RRXRR domain-containing protein [Nostoc sp. LEGE 06077]
MTKVLILDADQQPLSPVRISHARTLLSQGKAAVFQRYPFTIILKESFSQIKPEQLGFKLQPSTVTARKKKPGIDISLFSKRGNR